MIFKPSYAAMLDKVNEAAPADEPIIISRYSIVLAASKRARQLIAANRTEVDGVERKALSIAVDEIMEGKVNILAEASENYESYEEDENGRI